jgi:predicted nucleotidyltransferase
MTVISVPSSRPLEARKADVLARVAAATQGSVAQPMLVGAFARDVWFWHGHGIETERATEDLDISMAFADWQGVQAFAQVLLSLRFVQPDLGHPEKFVDPYTQQKLDLLPFGDLSVDGVAIIWPSDQSRWSILGFAESYQNAKLLPLTPSLAFRVATLPAIVMLKLVSFYERLEARKRKDGSDIGFTLAHYVEASNKTRLIHGVDADVMDLVDGDILRAGSVLLGRDMGRLARPGTRDHLVSKLRIETGSSTCCHLAKEIRSRVTHGDFARARLLLGGMLCGMESVAHGAGGEKPS